MVQDACQAHGATYFGKSFAEFSPLSHIVFIPRKTSAVWVMAGPWQRTAGRWQTVCVCCVTAVGAAARSAAS